MPIQRRSGEQPVPGASKGAPGTTLERLVPFWFAAAAADAREHRDTYLTLMETLYGRFDDLSWLDDGKLVNYHDMADTVVRELGPALAGVDLVITVQASPDSRQQSFPAARLADILPGDPFVFGVSEQGVAGPFLALRMAVDRIGRGLSHRALILVMEQSTLPPDAAAIRPEHDVAVAIVVGPNGSVPIGRPTITVTGRAGPATAVVATGEPVDPAVPGDDAAALVVGDNLADLVPGPGVSVTRGGPGHACAGVWLALARLLTEGTGPSGGRVLVVDQDLTLPYLCSVDLTLPVGAASSVVVASVLREPEPVS